MTPDFPALAAARRHAPGTRVALTVAGRVLGSVARACVDVLASDAPWLAATPQGLRTSLQGDALAAAFARSNAALRERGLITGWRDEAIALLAIGEGGAEPTPITTIERASARFWGSLTLGAHANGYVADAQGRPTALWIAERSETKPTDPGKLDNLVGGGVPAGQSPFDALVREAWEEAGLDATAASRARLGRVVEIERALPDCAGHGLQREWLYSFDLELDAGVVPRNQDGEVASLRLVPIAEALALAAGDAMTVDAALVTLDFALRHALLADEAHAALAPRFEALLVPRGAAG